MSRKLSYLERCFITGEKPNTSSWASYAVVSPDGTIYTKDFMGELPDRSRPSWKKLYERGWRIQKTVNFCRLSDDIPVTERAIALAKQIRSGELKGKK